MTIFGETVVEGVDSVYRGTLVHAEASGFQSLEIFDHPHFGRMLILDGCVQTTERDEFCYHEMLVHPALLSRDPVAGSLVIGGGDGGTLRRMLEHGGDVVMCEIDEMVTRASRAHLPSVSAGALDHVRATVLFEDGAALVARERDAFDAIVVDSTDPVGPAVVLSSPGFYADCREALRPGGVLVAQTGSPLFQLEEMKTAVRNMSQVFRTVETYLGFVPTYPGVLWSFTAGTDGDPVSSADPSVMRSRMHARGIATRFYDPDVHAAAFALPVFVRESVEQARAEGAAAPVPGR